MVTAIEYALMAGASYISTRAEVNQFPVPDGWLELVDERRSLPSGFEATYFTKGAEIVISFAGTTDLSDWVHGNTLALGLLPDQLRQAADYYLQVKASAPTGATISFTGHSLGGGLASLMAVMFGERAFTFDQAPFRSAALTYSRTDPFTHEVITSSVAQDVLTYLQGETTNGQPKYTASQLNGLISFVAALNNAAPGIVPNEGNVTDINVSGEILTFLPFSRIGAQADIPQQNNMFPVLGRVDLHSQALLTAFLQSNQTADAFKGLSDVTFKLNDLLKMIFDPKLFRNDPNNRAPDAPENFLERLVKHQSTVIDPATGATDAMVTRFTSDLWKLAQDGGMTLKDGLSNSTWVNNTLIAFAMQKYYEESTTSAGYKQELFTDLSAANEGSGGVRFDLADVSSEFATAFAQGKPLDLSKAKGFDLYFRYYLDNNLDIGDINFTAVEDQMILSVLPAMRDWYVQAGSGGMVATDTLNRGAFMLGGKGSDVARGIQFDMADVSKDMAPSFCQTRRREQSGSKCVRRIRSSQISHPQLNNQRAMA